MSPLAAAVLAVGALALVDLVLTVGVVRRLREHSDLLGRTAVPAAASPGGMSGTASVGTPVPSFTAGPPDSPVTDRDLADGTLVAFFSPTCAPCRDKLPGFVARYADSPEEARQVLAVVVSDTHDTRGSHDTQGSHGSHGDRDSRGPDRSGEDTGSMAAALAAVVPTVKEPYDGPVTTAFAVKAFPSCVRVGRGPDGGLVVTEVGLWPRTPVAAR
ncbi:redoxin domain-containing protein [Streptomyces sp. NPDC017546]|uniref:redoxin domain-containing protein n=1 Tax=unclassified Streptomyces TaxID=2593676 RepID=UPI00235DD506|nr:redoxin domain-containing protein [Streptomyces sp. MMBL 11-1]